MDIPYTLGPSVGTRARLGMIVLQSDETLEYDLRRIIPAQDIALFITRVRSAPTVSTETLAQMERDLPQAASLLPPAKFAAVGYGCTSGTSVIGAGRIDELIRSGTDTQATTNPMTALIAACAHLGVTQLSFLSPYVEQVSAHLRSCLNEQGIITDSFANFNEESEAAVARIDTPSVIDAAVTLHERNPQQAIFMSCTNLQTLDAIPEIERSCGVPVLSSNLCLAWHLAYLAGITPLQDISSKLLQKSA